MTTALMELILYLSLATLIVTGVLVLIWAISGERQRDDTRDEGDR